MAFASVELPDEELSDVLDRDASGTKRPKAQARQNALSAAMSAETASLHQRPVPVLTAGEREP
jgi:hypothetical protein